MADILSISQGWFSESVHTIQKKLLNTSTRMYTHFVEYWTQKCMNLENVLKKIFLTVFLIKKTKQKPTFFCLYGFVAKFWNLYSFWGSRTWDKPAD